jgi:diguanylate cyclase (GGDEF)-like protein
MIAESKNQKDLENLSEKMVQKIYKVLYIEDDPNACMLMRRVLEKSPFLYFEANSGLAGMQIALREQPHLIIMDIDLPDIRGDELTTKMKNTEKLAETVVVALTGLQEQNAREQTLIAGCDGFLTKPINVRNFSEQLLQFLKGKKEILGEDEKEFFHSRYELSIVDRLASKVQELEIFNRRLETTSQRLREYNTSLESVLSILSVLQASGDPERFKKNLVDEICKRFNFERCAFIDVDPDRMVMEIKYARGIDESEWESYEYPVNSPFIRSMFENRQVLLVRNLDQIEDPKLKNILNTLESSQFLFAYLGIPINEQNSADFGEGVLPLFESFMPSLHNQEDIDMDIILGNLKEYLSSESLYRAGFIFLDNYKTGRSISTGEYRFLETLIRTASYMYQNLFLMEQLRFLFIKAEKEAITDPLTDLYNYRYFLLQLNREISRSQRHKSLFSLIMIDIDFFKHYNDKYGHQSGDLILRRIAHAMLENTRTSDMVCRYGGEEFCIICPELSKEDAQKTAEKLRQIVEKLELPQVQSVPGGKLTISSGVASFPVDGSTAYQLILNADKALYRAKETGRNKVCVSL